MSKQFNEDGTYNKTDWKAGDKITATKLNKIEDAIEAVNDHDISRHEEADARLDALEAGVVANKREIEAKVEALEDTVVSNKDAADLDIYRIDQHMTLLDKKIDEGVAEVYGVAETVDGKIAKAEADMAAMVAEVETDLEGLHAKDEELSAQLAQKANKDFIYVTDYDINGVEGIDYTTSLISLFNDVDNCTVFFPKGVYEVSFDNANLLEFRALIPIKTGTHIKMHPEAIIRVTDKSINNRHNSVFGVTLTNYDSEIKNLKFEVNMEGSYVSDLDKDPMPIAIGFWDVFREHGYEGIINNIDISNSTFRNFSTAIFISQNIKKDGVGTRDRIVKNVRIYNNYAENCTGAFVVADGKDISIKNNYANGNTTGAYPSYDSVSVHSGIGIEIVNNTFKNYNNNGINVRNSSENMCGSENILIQGNRYENCTDCLVGIQGDGGENVYGVKNVMITNNYISNHIKGKTTLRIHPATVNNLIDNIFISGNTIIGAEDGYCFRIEGNTLANACVVRNNTLISNNSTSVELYFTNRSVFSNNYIYTNNSNIQYDLYIHLTYNTEVKDNTVICYPGTTYSETKITSNNELIFSKNKCIKMTVDNSNKAIIEENETLNNNSVLDNNLPTMFKLNKNNNVIYKSDNKPSRGKYKKGDMVENTNLVSGGFLGWVCVDGDGTNLGTWKGYGLIEN